MVCGVMQITVALEYRNETDRILKRGQPQKHMNTNCPVKKKKKEAEEDIAVIYNNCITVIIHHRIACMKYEGARVLIRVHFNHYLIIYSKMREKEVKTRAKKASESKYSE